MPIRTAVSDASYAPARALEVGPWESFKSVNTPPATSAASSFAPPVLPSRFFLTRPPSGLGQLVRLRNRPALPLRIHQTWRLSQTPPPTRCRLLAFVSAFIRKRSHRGTLVRQSTLKADRGGPGRLRMVRDPCFLALGGHQVSIPLLCQLHIPPMVLFPGSSPLPQLMHVPHRVCSKHRSGRVFLRDSSRSSIDS